MSAGSLMILGLQFSTVFASICIITLFNCSMLLGHRIWIFLGIGYICFYHDFPVATFAFPLCIFTDVVRSPIDLFVVLSGLYSRDLVFFYGKSAPAPEECNLGSTFEKKL
jgi:hypothetical protein